MSLPITLETGNLLLLTFHGALMFILLRKSLIPARALVMEDISLHNDTESQKQFYFERTIAMTNIMVADQSP